MKKNIIFVVIFLCICSQSYAINLTEMEPMDGTWTIMNVQDWTLVRDQDGKIEKFDKSTVFFDCTGNISPLASDMLNSKFTAFIKASSNATSEEISHVQAIKIICE